MRFFKHSAVLLTIVFLGLKAGTVSAAQIFTESQDAEMQVGDEHVLEVFLDTEEEEVNALEGSLAFPAGAFEIKEVRDGNSAVTFWITRPNVSGERILFSGIIPGGHVGKKSPLFAVVVRPLHTGLASVDVREAQVLLNDGKGTPTSVRVRPLALVVSEAISQQGVVAPQTEDREPPEAFVPLISSDVNLLSGKRFLVFATQDKGSGIDHYEVREGGGQYRVAESPYLLQNQKADQDIFVKAVDKMGYERVATLALEAPRAPYQKYAFFVILFLIGIVTGTMLFRRK
jgi:hypothetical protein